jgi:transcriptional regulator with XRE-family HTH domain
VLGCGRVRGAETVAEQPALSFAGLVRQLRAEAGLTQEELAEAAGLPVRTLSDLERGVSRTAHQDTARLLASALGLAGPVAGVFVAAARGKVAPAEVVVARQRDALGAFAAAATRSLPRDVGSFTGRQAELAKLRGTLTVTAMGGGVVVGIHAIDGMAGVGKTAFAVHVAHRLTGSFPDGQFFLPLHAHTQGRWPRGCPRRRSRLAWRPGRPGGVTTSRARRSCWCSMTRPGMSRSGRCCPVPRAAWC